MYHFFYFGVLQSGVANFPHFYTNSWAHNVCQINFGAIDFSIFLSLSARCSACATHLILSLLFVVCEMRHIQVFFLNINAQKSYGNTTNTRTYFDRQTD